MKVALCFMTKDRVELSRRTIEGVIGKPMPSSTIYDLPFDLWIMDGSKTDEGTQFPLEVANHFKSGSERIYTRHNVVGGPDAAVAYAVTECLKHDYTHIGIVENDVLLRGDWYPRVLALFERARNDDLEVGAASARCYEDRVLFQRGPGYNIMHNLGFGMVIWTRQAAELVLKYMRTHWTLENRRAFSFLADVDLGDYWAFRVHEGWICADWGVDRVLAQHGLCSVALDPSPVEMIGQIPVLSEQGLTIATERELGFAHDTKENFAKFVERQNLIRFGEIAPFATRAVHQVRAGWMHFAHQMGALDGFERDEGWKLHWNMGCGPFGYRADESGGKLRVRLSGQAAVMVSGYEKGGSLLVRDLVSGYEANPTLPGARDGYATLFGVSLPGSTTTRVVEIEAGFGVTFFGIMAEEAQPEHDFYRFNHSVLPCV